MSRLRFVTGYSRVLQKRTLARLKHTESEVNCDVSKRAMVPLTGSSGHIFRRTGAMREGQGPGVIEDVVRNKMKRI